MPSFFLFKAFVKTARSLPKLAGSYLTLANFAPTKCFVYTYHAKLPLGVRRSPFITTAEVAETSFINRCCQLQGNRSWPLPTVKGRRTVGRNLAVLSRPARGPARTDPYYGKHFNIKTVSVKTFTYRPQLLHISNS